MIRDVVNPVAVYINPIGFYTPVFVLTAKDTSGHGHTYEVRVERKDEMCSPPPGALMALDDTMPGWVRIGKLVTFIHTREGDGKPISMFEMVRAFKRDFINDAINGSMLFMEFCETFGYDAETQKAFEVYLLCQNTLRKTRLLQLKLDQLYRIDEGIENNIVKYM